MSQLSFNDVSALWKADKRRWFLGPKKDAHNPEFFILNNQTRPWEKYCIPSSNLGLSAKKDSLTGCLFSCRDLRSTLPLPPGTRRTQNQPQTCMLSTERYSLYTKPGPNVYAQNRQVHAAHKTGFAA